MKRCPTCSRTFAESLSFCLEDGTPLVPDASADDSEATLVTPDRRRENLPATQAHNQFAGKPAVPGTGFQLPTTQPYVASPAQRRVWPWVVALLAVLFLVIIAIVFVAIAIPAMMRASNNNRPAPSETPGRAPYVVATPGPALTPAVNEDEPPADSAQVLSQLTKLEEEWTRANVEGDKKALERILAEEYVGGANSHTKREYIDSLAPNPAVKSWELQNLSVDLNGDRATIAGYVKEDTTDGTQTLEFTDKFVWRDGRWQAVSSQTTRVK